MKCRSIAGIWPAAPPIHRVTATAVLDQPPTVYTGATDGSIVWWTISDNDSKKEIKPVAVLCGHASPIADLGICSPLLASADGNVDRTSDLTSNFACSNYGALASASRDGVLCVWSRGSGHCRRRRKLPPWVGSPSVVRKLPANPRYICIACCFIDAIPTDQDSRDPSEVTENQGESELNRKPNKCTIIIVDSYALTIVQTVFHGNLSIGPLKFMALVRPFDDKLQFVLVIDSFGQLQLIPMLKESNLDTEDVTKLNYCSSHVKMTNCSNISHEGALILSIDTNGVIVGLLYKTNCVFVLVANGTVIGGISFENSVLFSESDASKSHPVGGMFLHCDNIDPSNARETRGIVASKFAVWNDRGFTVVFSVSYIDSIFKSEVVCEIPSGFYPIDMKISIIFLQLDHYLLRIESICLSEEGPSVWKPHITIWSLGEQLYEHENAGCHCKLLGEGDFLMDWVDGFSHTPEMECSEHSLDRAGAARKAVLTTWKSTSMSKESIDSVSKDDLKYMFPQKECIVSCSMVLSQNTDIPYAIVYGYRNGEIELVEFQGLLDEVNLDDEDVHLDAKHSGSIQKFSGHTGAVLCLAAHQMVGTPTGQTFRHVLLSGSMDCTVRVWDLETSNPIKVMRHHVAAVHQLILPPIQIDRPWNDCFLSVGEDFCVALASLETLRVERMFPGHPNYPAKVVWDGWRGYLACLSQNHSVATGTKDVLYIWDIKTGARERVLRGTASHSMFDYFCKRTNANSIPGRMLNINTSASSLLLPLVEDGSSLQFQLKSNKGPVSSNGANLVEPILPQLNTSVGNSTGPDPGPATFYDKLPVRCFCPFSGIAILSFDLACLMAFVFAGDHSVIRQNAPESKVVKDITSPHQRTVRDESNVGGNLKPAVKRHNLNKALAVSLLRFSLSFLHLWDVDFELDDLLKSEMRLNKPDKFIVAPGLQGDRGAVTLAFPGFSSTLELWKSSSEFCAMRSLTMVSLAQCMVSLSGSCSTASSSLSAFYTRNFAEKFPYIKSPSLQLLVSFWQDEVDHVRMAARSLFHCAASRAIPPPLLFPKAIGLEENMSTADLMRGSEGQYEEKSASYLDTERLLHTPLDSQNEDNEILKWMESFELQDWISCVGGTSQDAMASHIIVAAALAIWYPSLVKPSLAMLAIHPLIKLVMAMNDKYSSAAAELLAEGMESTWKPCIISEIPRLIGDIFFQIECVSGASANASAVSPVVPPKLRETLVGVLLPSLALADLPGFVTVVEGLIWSTSSDSPVHLVSLKTLIRVMRGSPRSLAQYLNKVVNFILQTMDPSNLVMRKACLQSSMAALKEVTRVYPMVAWSEMSARLAVGDAISEINCANIHVYDMQSVTKIKVLDASGPAGLPNLLVGASETVTTAISALSFSPDGEGLVAFSEHGLIIRWWSLGSAWWEKLSRNFALVQCTKLIFVPPWEGFSPNSSRASIMAKIAGNDKEASSQEQTRGLNDVDSLNMLIHNLDLSYRLEWVGERKLVLARQGHALGTFQL